MIKFADLLNEGKPRELIQNDEWWKTHDKGVGWYATVRARKIKDKHGKNERFFIGTTKEVEKLLGKKWLVWAI